MTGILSGKQPKKTVDADTSVCLDDSELRPVFIPSPKKKAGVGCEEEGCGRRCGRILLCLIGFAVISVLLVAGATLFLFPHTSSYWLGLGRAWPLAHADDVDVEWSRAIQDEMERLSELGSFASNILYLGGVVPSVNYQLFPAATSIIRNLSETRQSQSETLDKEIASSHVHGKVIIFFCTLEIKG